MAGDVCSGERVHQGQSSADKVGQVVAGQFGGPHVLAGERHEAASEQAADQDADDAEAALIEAPCEIGAAEDADDADGAGGDREQLRLLGGEAEALDDQGGEAADGAVGDVDRGHDDGDEIGLRVPPHLEELFHLEVLVFDPGLVLSQTLNGPDLLLVAEARGHRVVREEDDHDDSHGDRDETEDQEHDLPAVEPVAGVEEEPVCDEGAHDGGCSRSHVPESHTPWLLYTEISILLLTAGRPWRTVSLVPH